MSFLLNVRKSIIGIILLALLFSSLLVNLSTFVSGQAWDADQSTYLDPKWTGYIAGGGEALLTYDVITTIPGEEVFHAGGPPQPSNTTGWVTCLNGVTGDRIWNKSIYGVGDTATLQLVDVEGDYQLEVVVALQSPAGLYILNAEDGSELWKAPGTVTYNETTVGGFILPIEGRVDGSGVAGDIDGDGFPTIFLGVMGYEKQPESGKLIAWEWDPTQGTMVEQARTKVWHPCAGGLSLGDTDNDGVFELYMNERDAYYGDGSWGRGLTSFWAENLTLRWRIYDWGASSNIPMLADVNKDGILDIVTTNLGTGVCVLNSTDGRPLTNEKGVLLCNQQLGLPVHYQSTIYDIDGDGSLELLCADGTHAAASMGLISNYTMVWDLYNWQFDAVLNTGLCFRGPSVGEVTGDGVKDFIVASYNETGTTNDKVEIYDGNFNLVDQYTGLKRPALGSVVQDIDRDDGGLNELLVLTQGGIIYCFDTPGLSEEHQGRERAKSEIHFYSESRNGASEYIPFHQPYPDVGSPYPQNGAVGVSTAVASLSFTLNHPKGEPVDYVVTSSPNIASASVNDVGIGKFNVAVNGPLAQNTLYHWQITATDNSGHVTTKDYSFTTEPYVANSAPTQGTPILTGPDTQTDLTAIPQGTHDNDGNIVTNIYNWQKNGASITNLNMPFDTKTDSQQEYIGNATTKDYAYDAVGQVFGATWIPDGKVGGAYSFDGNDFVRVEEQNNRFGGDGSWSEISVEAWVKVTESMNNKAVIWKTDRYATGQVGYRLGCTADLPNSLLTYQWLVNTTTGAYDVTCTLSSGASSWHHVVCTYKSGLGLTIYVDGIPMASKATEAGTILPTEGPLEIAFDSSVDLTGVYDIAGYIAAKRDFTGVVDEVRVYSYQASEAYVNQRYQETKDGLSNQSNIPHNDFVEGDHWSCQVIPNDGAIDGAAKSSNSIRIGLQSVFKDGFESGDFSKWTGTTVSTGGTATVTTSNAYSGTYSGQFAITAGTANATRRAYSYVNVDSLVEVYASAYVYIPSSLTLSSAQKLFAIQLNDAAGTALASYGVIADATGTHWAVQYDSSSYAVATTGPSGGSWYQLEAYFTHAASGPTLKLSVNSVQVAVLSQDTSAANAVASARFGQVFYNGANTLTINIDQVAVDTTTTPTFGLKKATGWLWNQATVVNSITAADVDNDGQTETITGGHFNDGTRNVAQLIVWNTNLEAEKIQCWYWTGDTTINSVVADDVDGDGQTEIVTGGYFNDGIRNIAQLMTWSGNNLAVESTQCWYWTANTEIKSVATGDVDGDAQIEIVTGGYFNDGTRDVAQLIVWSGVSLSVERIQCWYWTSNTVINSIALGDTNGDGQAEVVSAGRFNDGTRDIAQIIVWSGNALEAENMQCWYWISNTEINSAAVSDVDGDGQAEVLTGGYFNDGTRNVAQLIVWSGSGLAVKNMQCWYWTSNTEINSIATGDIDGDGDIEVVTAGEFDDGTRDIAQLIAWSGTDLTAEVTQSWYWTSDNTLNAVAIGNVDSDSFKEIVTGGYFNDGTYNTGQITVWGMT